MGCISYRFMIFVLEKEEKVRNNISSKWFFSIQFVIVVVRVSAPFYVEETLTVRLNNYSTSLRRKKQHMAQYFRRSLQNLFPNILWGPLAASMFGACKAPICDDNWSSLPLTLGSLRDKLVEDARKPAMSRCRLFCFPPLRPLNISTWHCEPETEKSHQYSRYGPWN